MTFPLREKGRPTGGANISAVPDSPPAERDGEFAGPVPRRPRRISNARLSAMPLVAIALGVALTAGSSLAVARAGEDTAPKPLPAKVYRAYVEDPVPTTVTTLPAETAPAVVTPAPPPPPREKAPLVKLGEIHIPRIGLVHPIYEGVSLTVVDHGPGHWPGSAMPGQLGNTVFAGHRTTHSRPFRHVDQLVPGDEVILVTDAGRFRYTVTGTEIVGSRDTWIVTPTPDATMTLFACHPPGSARQRIVIRGVYAGAESVLS